jgi:hypothetical protein
MFAEWNIGKRPMILLSIVRYVQRVDVAEPIFRWINFLLNVDVVRHRLTYRRRPFTCDHVVELLTFKQPLNSSKPSLHEKQQQTPCQTLHIHQT